MVAIQEHMTAAITVDEDLRGYVAATKDFYRENREVILVSAILVVALYINRRLIRRDLKSLNFTAEFFPDYLFDEDGEFVGDIV